MKRALRILGIGILAFLVLVVGGSAAVYYLIGFDRLANEAIARHKPEIEEAVGRTLRVGPLESGFFPTLSLRIPDVAIEGKEEGEPPLLELGAVEVDFALWKAILSFGKTLEIRDITVQSPRIVVLRRADGSLSFEDLLEEKEEAPRDEEESEPPSVLEGLRIDRIRVVGGAIYLLDGERPVQEPLAATALSYVEAIDLELRDIGRGETLGLDLSLAALASEKNFALGFRAGPLADFPPQGLPPIRDLRMDAKGIELRSLGAFLGEAGAPLEAARLTAHLDIPDLHPSRPIALDAALALEGLRLEGAEAFDLRGNLKGEIKPASGDVSIESMLVDLGGMRLSARGAIRDARTLPRFEDFELRSEEVRLERLLALLPPLAEKLPEGARLEGPLHLEVKSSGDSAAQSVQARLDLGDADLFVPGALAKPKGVALGFFADVDLAAGGADLREVRLRAADLDLRVEGKLTSFDPPAYDLRLRAEPFAFDSLVRLAPSVAESLAASGARAAGQGQVEGHLRGKDAAIDASLRLALLGASLSVPQAEVKGDLSLALRFEGDPARAWEGGLRLDGGASRLFVPELVDKAPATPLYAEVEVRKKPERIDLPTFDVRLGALRLDAQGAIDLGGGSSSLLVTLPRADLAVLRSTFLFLPDAWTGEGHIEGALRVEGDPQRPGTLALAIPSLAGRIGKSDFSLEASVRNPEAPIVLASVRSSYLDLDALLGNDEEGGAGKEREKAPKEDRPELRKIQATAELAIDRARFTGRDLSKVAAKVVLRDGTLVLEEARFDLYGGRVSAAGTEAEIWRGKMPYDVRLEVRGIDVQAAIAGETDSSSFLAGRGDLELSVRGLGTEREDFEKHLSGLWTLSMKEGRIVGPDISASALGGLHSIPAFAGARLPSERNLRDLFGAFEIEDGQMNLRDPLRFQLGQSNLTLGGGVGIFGDLRLSGHYEVPPSLITSLSRGRCKGDAPVEVPLAIAGRPSAPKISADGKAIALALGERCLLGQAEAAAERLLGKETVDKVRNLEDTARKEAEAAAVRAKAEAEEAANRARAEAEARKRELERQAAQKKKEAEKKAQDAARKAADKARKRLGF